MYYDGERGGLSFLVGMIVGLAIGAGLALLLAPQSGRRTRRYLSRRVEDVADEALDRWDDVADELRGAVKTSRKRLSL
ncbi:MAG: YtxH domain-containing protein [Gemmatimonadota bacterium]